MPAFHLGHIQRFANPSSQLLAIFQEYNPLGARLRQVRGAPVGLYKRKDSRFWWMGYTAKGEQRCESTKTSSKDLAKKIWNKREADIPLGLFQAGGHGKRMTLVQLSDS